jgi:uncharacterized damage-inducible protein DinB
MEAVGGRVDQEMLRSLFAYNHWVNDRLLALVEQVAPERLQEQMGGSFDSIQGTAAHILQGELFYYYRWIGQQQPQGRRPSERRTIGELRALWAENRALIDAFLERLTPEQLYTPLRYGRRNSQATYELPLWKIMLQMINHGTHHRAELADMLTRVGLEPPPTDLIVFFEEQAGPIPVGKA